MSSSVKSFLRIRYELAVGGVISDRQWRRIRRELGVESEDDWLALEQLEAYAVLRKMFPKSPLDIRLVNQYLIFVQHFPLLEATGSDLLNAAQKILKPQPSERTIRGWGYEIKCPLYTHKWYSKEELNLWMAKIFSQRRFKISLDLPKSRRIENIAI